MPLFGKSFTYAAARLNSRIDFQFDNAAFHFRFLPFTIPYPVPFRLLGDETKVSLLPLPLPALHPPLPGTLPPAGR